VAHTAILTGIALLSGTHQILSPFYPWLCFHCGSPDQVDNLGFIWVDPCNPTCFQWIKKVLSPQPLFRFFRISPFLLPWRLMLLVSAWASFYHREGILSPSPANHLPPNYFALPPMFTNFLLSPLWWRNDDDAFWIITSPFLWTIIV